ncbi:MAG: diaminopimelate decarboxylase [Verrucomicrobia bacterium]|nr:MAG: diaminopimelate decarboxylase [Verrucomicrobiota bacterium]PYL63288.1 MAG: diaminopimelate decarboxylase [Verrucomicrobiota bacterium]
MHFFRYRDGKLHCEDVDLARVADEFGTPLYVYSAGTILDHYTRLDAALAPLDHLICYAVKANSNRAILKLLGDAGAGFDIVSGGELYRVIAAGGDVGKCTFAGVGKSREEMEFALERGVYSFNVESEAELEYIDRIASTKNLRAPIALRANPDVDPHTHAYVSTGSRENKFGIALGELPSVYERAAKMRNIEIVGVQMHIGSQITEAGPFASAISKVTPLVRELKSKYGIMFFSIGGGMGIVYRRALESGSGKWWHNHGPACAGSAFSVRDYADAIVPPLRELGIRVLVEPGRFLVGNAGVLLTRVRYIKQTAEKKFAIVDAGMNDLIRPALYQSYHEIVPVKEPWPVAETDSFPSSKSRSMNKNMNKTEKIDIVGPVCESGDFFVLDREMPKLHEGDLLAIMSAGAYGFMMASNYNSRPLAAEALVRGDKFSLIRKRQTWEDLVRGEVEAEW